MKNLIIASALAALFAFASFGDIVVDAQLPAGNIVFENIVGNTVSVHQDLRDTEGDWFYWAMRVTGAAGRTLTFKFTQSDAVGVRGPVVTTDSGQTYGYPLADKLTASGVTRRQFTYTFGANENETWFYECIPYTPENWAAFLARHEAKRGTWFETGVLCQSTTKKADVPKARFGCLTGTPKYRLLLTARHHCSETVASYVLEGIAAAFLKDDEFGEWLRENVLCEAVPFVDYDGAVAGDQGKNRKPHDHNRDYTEFLFTETKAVSELATALQPDVWFDIHCPTLSGGCNEYLYTPGKRTDLPYSHPANEARFSQILEATVTSGALPYKASNDIPFGEGWNTGANYDKGLSSIHWALNYLGSVKLCRTFEVPFANASGTLVTEPRLRTLGGDIMKATKAFLVGEGVASGTLPSGYLAVDYVQSTHEQYVDTGYRPNAKTTIYFKFAAVDYDEAYVDTDGKDPTLVAKNNVYVLACYNDRCQFAYGNTWFLGFGKGYDNTHGMTKDTDVHEMGLTNGTFYIDGELKYKSSDKSFNASPQQSLSVFALNSDGKYRFWCAAKVYSLVISEDGVVKHEFQPAVRLSDLTPGLYDLWDANPETAFHESKTKTKLVAPNVEIDIPTLSLVTISGTKEEGYTAKTTVTGGLATQAKVECWMGNSVDSLVKKGAWDHTVSPSTYAGTLTGVTYGETAYAKFKLTYTLDGKTTEIWSELASYTLTGTDCWRGGNGGAWSDGENWSLGVVPTKDIIVKFENSARAVAGAGPIATKSFYALKGDVVLDFQPETMLPTMTYLHIGGKDASPKTAANLIVSNGAITATGSLTFDTSESSVHFAGTKATFPVKTYLDNVGGTALKLTDGAEVKLSAIEAAGNATGGDTYFVGADSTLVLTGKDEKGYGVSSKIPKNSTVTIDGGVWSNLNTTTFNTVAGGTNRLTVRNGGAFVAKNNLTLGGQGATSVSVQNGGAIRANEALTVTNACVTFVVPKSGFADVPAIVAGKNVILAADGSAELSVDATDCASADWMTLMKSSTGEIKNLSLDQVSMSAAKGKLGELRLVKDGADKVTALQFRIKPVGLMILFR